MERGSQPNRKEHCLPPPELWCASSAPSWQNLTGNQLTKGKYSLPSPDSEPRSRVQKGSRVVTQCSHSFLPSDFSTSRVRVLESKPGSRLDSVPFLGELCYLLAFPVSCIGCTVLSSMPLPISATTVRAHSDFDYLWYQEEFFLDLTIVNSTSRKPTDKGHGFALAPGP